METEKMVELYQNIANTVNEIIPEEWVKVFIYAEVLEDVSKVTFHYITKSGDNPINMLEIPELFDLDENEIDELRYKLNDYFEELWSEFHNNNQEPWTNLTMYLDNTGDFKIDYSYEDLSDADDYERSIIWEHKYLGITPDDEDDKKFLDNYLKATEGKE